MNNLTERSRTVAILLLLCLVTTAVMADGTKLLTARDSVPTDEGVKEKWRFERVRRPETPPGVWEISGRLLPWTKYSYGYLNRYTTDATANSTYPYIFTNTDGTPLTLYNAYDSYYSGYSSEPARFGLVIAGLEIARRIPSGVRFSVGITYFKDGARSKPSPPAATAPGEYLLFSDNSGWTSWYMNFGVQYVINRRGRFRTSLGLHLLGTVYEVYENTQFLVGGDPVERIPVSRFTSRNASFFSFPVPLPQIGFEYQLKRNWSISAGIGVLTGIGATYNFTPKRKWGV